MKKEKAPPVFRWTPAVLGCKVGMKLQKYIKLDIPHNCEDVSSDQNLFKSPSLSLVGPMINQGKINQIQTEGYNCDSLLN